MVSAGAAPKQAQRVAGMAGSREPIRYPSWPLPAAPYVWLPMQYSIVAKVKAAAGRRSARGLACGFCCTGAEDTAPDLHVTVPDPSAFGLYPHGPPDQEPAVYFQAPQMLGFRGQKQRAAGESGELSSLLPHPYRLARRAGPARLTLFFPLHLIPFAHANRPAN